jgi:hypothetical protein
VSLIQLSGGIISLRELLIKFGRGLQYALRLRLVRGDQRAAEMFIKGLSLLTLAHWQMC